MTYTLMRTDRCPRCGRVSFETDAQLGEVYCSKCGFVVKERTEEQGPEWRSFSQDGDGESKSRVGAPFSLASHDMGLTTVIGEKDRDAAGRFLSLQTRAAVERLRTWDKRSFIHGSADQNLRRALFIMDRIADRLNAGNLVVERGAYMYRKALAKGLTRGRPTPALVSAAIYAACRDTATLRNLKDIAAASNVKRKEIAKCYRLLVSELDMKIPVVDPCRCVPRIASRSGLSEKTNRRAMEMLREASRLGVLEGKDPMGLAAAALYTACVLEHEHKKQRDLAAAAGVTEVTIRNRCKTLEQALHLREAPISQKEAKSV